LRVSLPDLLVNLPNYGVASVEPIKAQEGPASIEELPATIGDVGRVGEEDDGGNEGHSGSFLFTATY
jgi:hypothetical protein